MKSAVMVTFLSVMNTINVLAVDKNEVPEYKQTRAGQYLSSKGAYEEIQTNENKILFLDVRTLAEVAVVGMPTVADANIPYMFMAKPMIWNDDWGGFKMTRNLNFLNAVKR